MKFATHFFTLIKPQLSANNKRYEDGKKGGRPKKIKTSGFSEKNLMKMKMKMKMLMLMLMKM